MRSFDVIIFLVITAMLIGFALSLFPMGGLFPAQHSVWELGALGIGAIVLIIIAGLQLRHMFRR